MQRSTVRSSILKPKTIIEYRPNVLLLSLAMGLSIMYCIYVFDFNQGNIDGGRISRTLLKLFFLLTFSFSLYRFLDIRSFLLNIPVKLPLVFLLLYSFVGSLIFLEGSYRQAINIIFFAPVLFINWNKPGGDELYRYIWRAITLVVLVQFITDPILKAYTGVRWENNALVGGMGNPNVYGLFLLVSATYIYLYSKSYLRIMSLPMALLAILTGSLVCSLVGILMAVIIILRGGYLAIGTLLVLGFASLVFSIEFLDVNLEDLLGMAHAIGKIQGLLSLLDAGVQIGSVNGRLDYLKEGLNLIKDNPGSLLVGHPDSLQMFNGDGTWISFIVTHGVPFTLLFQLSNLYLIFRSARCPKIEFVFSFFVLNMFQVFFITNRILDYWPAGFLYLLVFSYCSTRGVYKVKAVVFREHYYRTIGIRSSGSNVG